MSKVLGNSRKCYISNTSSAPAAGGWLGGEVSNSVNLNGNLVETSDKSTAWQTFIQGIKGATATVTVHADTADANQTNILAALVAGSTVKVFIGDLTNNHGYAFTAHVASVDETNDNGSVASRTLNLTANGVVTVS